MNIIIIGAGPAGLFAAFSAAQNPNNQVLILEKNDIAGKKLLVSGSGRCNVTNGCPIEEFLPRYGGRDRFVKPALLDFDNSKLMEFFSSRHVRLVTLENGKVFPQSERSRDILHCILDELARLNVKIHTHSTVRSLDKDDKTGQFIVHTDNSDYRADKLIIAVGGKSYPATGSTGDAYAWLEKWGHTIVTPCPALAPVTVSGDFPLKSCAGIAIPFALMTLRRNGRKIIDMEGDLLITHTGFSGPGILDNSRFFSPGDELVVCWVDSVIAPQLDRIIIETLNQAGKKSIKNALATLGLPDRLLETLLILSGIEINPKTKLGDPASKRITASNQFFPCRIYGNSPGMTKEQRKTFIKNLRESTWTIESLGSFNDAMVTAGGVLTTEVNRLTMESRLIPGLFFAGEILDVDGDTGGFNLQWAFSSGFMAGKKASGVQ